MLRRWLAGMMLVAATTAALASGHLVVTDAWIRTAPPGAMMLAGYASLKNDGDAPMLVAGAESADFADVSLHQSIEENGVEKMRPIDKFSMAPGESVTFAPGGKHFMLMQPKRQLKSGDVVKIHVATESGAGADAEFTVRDTPP